jgi:hypothetical protein
MLPPANPALSSLSPLQLCDLSFRRLYSIAEGEAHSDPNTFFKENTKRTQEAVEK